MKLELEAYPGELKELRNAMETLKPFLHEYFHNQYFLDGSSGKEGKEGLPERLHVRPRYNHQTCMIYSLTEEESPASW